MQPPYLAPYLAGRRAAGASVLAGRAPLIRPEPDAAAILGSIGETLYQWDIATDRLDWGAGYRAVLGPFADLDLSTGIAFGALIAAENTASRYDVVQQSTVQDPGEGVAYQLVYALTPPQELGSVEPLWLEDTGRWFAGPDGRPARAQGVLRALAGPGQGGRREMPAASLDPLTGLPDRVWLLAQTQAFLARANHPEVYGGGDTKRYADGRTNLYADGRFTILLVTIENLFMLNQSCGYDVGDTAIAAVARLLRANVRSGDVVARYGGNKFALLLEDCGDAEAAAVGARLVALVAASSFETALGSLAARIRIGAVVAPQEGRAPQMLLLHAEEALDAARRAGGNGVVAYTRSLARDDTRSHVRRAADTILSAFADDRIELALQPVVRATDGAVAFYEALLRLRLPEGGVAALDDLLPAADKAGLMPALDARVMTLACARLVADPALCISVNCARASISAADWIETFAASIAATPGLGERLIVEVTETGLIENFEAMRAAIHACKNLGVRVAMDDFGAGHTSFRHLRDLGFDLVKIDGDFVRTIVQSADNRFFVKTLVDLARHLGLETVAEWVADEATARILREMGVDYFQGEYYGDGAV